MLINCIAYQNGHKLADLTIEDISDYVSHPDCFVWVALRDPGDEELAQMGEEFGLHPLALEDARHGHQRPKIEEYGDSLFAAMHLLEWDEDELAVGEVNVFVGPNYVLSVRNRSQHSLLGVRERCEREPEMLQLGAGFVFYALMDAVVDRYFPVIDTLESELEALEEAMFTKGSARHNVEGLYRLKRKLGVVRHAVVPLMEAAGKLHSGRVPAACANTRAYFRDVHDHLIRIGASLDAIRETITTAIQVNLSMIALEDADVNKRLAAWAGIFAVATAFAGIWGMNFAHMPELQWRWGYPAALALIAGSCSWLYWRFKRAKWL